MHSVSRHLFDSYPLPLFRRLTVGGCYREKFFFDFYFSDFARNLRMVGLRIFFEFYTRYAYLGKFFYFFCDFVPIRIRTRFYSEYLSF